MILGNYEVVKAPTLIRSAGIDTCRPESVILFSGVQVSEGIYVTLLQEIIEGFTFLWSVASNLILVLSIIDINWFVSNI